ncbi:MAG: FadR/GntR family transcriptional regulator [Acidimicrobiales bacterium]
MAVTPLRVPKAAELVADHLRKQIVRGELREGESLAAEASLTEQFGVSRPTLREAFRVLETEQLITVRRGARGGACVHAPSAAMVARYAGFYLEHDGATLADVLEARVAIEAPAAGLAAQRRTCDDLARLRDGIVECERFAGDRRRLVLQFSEFHALVVDVARNRTMALLHSVVREIIDMAKLRRLEQAGDRGKPLDRAVRAHRKLVDLIEARDSGGAESLWHRHLTEANRYLLAIPGGDEPLDLLD